eukprot:scaffold185804_cov45-Prasinocladus_malaysianus.AAC.1
MSDTLASQQLLSALSGLVPTLGNRYSGLPSSVIGVSCDAEGTVSGLTDYKYDDVYAWSSEIAAVSEWGPYVHVSNNRALVTLNMQLVKWVGHDCYGYPPLHPKPQAGHRS